MQWITWSIRKEKDGRYSVVGAFNAFGADTRYEVYQFETYDWAKLCRISMERLSYSPTTIRLVSPSNLAFHDGSAFTTTFSEQYLEELLKELTAKRLLQYWLAPVVAGAKQKGTRFVNRLLWGETGKHKLRRKNPGVS